MRLSRYSCKTAAKSPKPPSNIRFPVELYGRIFEFVPDRKDLFTLCTVSRSFHHEAERVLYNKVDLSHDHLLIMTWFESIAKNPRLAALVRTLTFGMVHVNIPMSPHTWLHIISNGLRTLINLKELNLRRKSRNFIDSKYAWIIRNHSFRLRTFRNDMFDLEPTISFLESQPGIAVWQQRNVTPCDLPDDILPHLADAALDPSILLKLPPRPITGITTRIERENAAAERRFLDMLGLYGQRLINLVLEREVVWESLPISEFIGLLTIKLPLLEHLSIRNGGETSTESTPHWEALVAAFSAFSRLTTLYLFPTFCPSQRSSNVEGLFMDDRIQAVSHLFQSLPSLQRVEFRTATGRCAWYAKSGSDSFVGDTIVQEGVADEPRTVIENMLGFLSPR